MKVIIIIAALTLLAAAVQTEPAPQGPLEIVKGLTGGSDKPTTTAPG